VGLASYAPCITDSAGSVASGREMSNVPFLLGWDFVTGNPIPLECDRSISVADYHVCCFIVVFSTC